MSDPLYMLSYERYEFVEGSSSSRYVTHHVLYDPVQKIAFDVSKDVDPNFPLNIVAFTPISDTGVSSFERYLSKTPPISGGLRGFKAEEVAEQKVDDLRKSLDALHRTHETTERQVEETSNLCRKLGLFDS